MRWLILLLLLSTKALWGQSDTAIQFIPLDSLPPIDVEKMEEPDWYIHDSICTMPDIPPSFPGGEEALFEFLGNHVKTPEDLVLYTYKKIIYVQFLVSKKGEISDIQLIRSDNIKRLDQEAIKVIRSMPNWIPAQKNGKPVHAYTIVPLRFFQNEE